ncbi:MAG: asparagine synthase (glutamine-hydrolyzing), partial [Pseudomonadota bacterium]|nr:asparagine synthase (glutamine-hydrolyzing) [Pseudomonadota bacterium]
MARRGPDDAQVYCHGEEGGRKVLLLHTRLSILDISSRARQPFTYNNTVLCYNGEIFNYKELRND